MSEPCPSLLAAPSSCTDQGRSPETATGAWRLAPGASMRVWPGRPAIEIGRGPAEKANQPAVYPVKAFLRPPPKFVRMASIQELKFQARRLYKEVSPRPPRLPLRSPHTVVTPHPEPSSLNMTPLSTPQLHFIARDYPDPKYPIHQKLHSCFLAHVGADEAKLRAGIAKATFIKKGARPLKRTREAQTEEPELTVLDGRGYRAAGAVPAAPVPGDAGEVRRRARQLSGAAGLDGVGVSPFISGRGIRIAIVPLRLAGPKWYARVGTGQWGWGCSPLRRRRKRPRPAQLALLDATASAPARQPPPHAPRAPRPPPHRQLALVAD